MRIKKVKNYSLLVFVLFGLFFIASTAIALNTCNTGYKVDSGENKDVDCHNVCKKVDNELPNHIFVPTKTSNEWSAFRNNLPNNVTLLSCNSQTSQTPQNNSGTDIYYHYYKYPGAESFWD